MIAILIPIGAFIVGLYIGLLRRKIERLNRLIEAYQLIEYHTRDLKPPPEGSTERWFSGHDMTCFPITEDKVILRIEDKECSAQEIYSAARWLDGIYCEMKGIEPSQLHK